MSWNTHVLLQELVAPCSVPSEFISRADCDSSSEPLVTKV